MPRRNSISKRSENACTRFSSSSRALRTTSTTGCDALTAADTHRENATDELAALAAEVRPPPPGAQNVEVALKAAAERSKQGMPADKNHEFRDDVTGISLTKEMRAEESTTVPASGALLALFAPPNDVCAASLAIPTPNVAPHVREGRAAGAVAATVFSACDDACILPVGTATLALSPTELPLLLSSTFAPLPLTLAVSVDVPSESNDWGSLLEPDGAEDSATVTSHPSSVLDVPLSTPVPPVPKPPSPAAGAASAIGAAAAVLSAANVDAPVELPSCLNIAAEGAIVAVAEFAVVVAAEDAARSRLRVREGAATATAAGVALAKDPAAAEARGALRAASAGDSVASRCTSAGTLAGRVSPDRVCTANPDGRTSSVSLLVLKPATRSSGAVSACGATASRGCSSMPSSSASLRSSYRRGGCTPEPRPTGTIGIEARTTTTGVDGVACCCGGGSCCGCCDELTCGTALLTLGVIFTPLVSGDELPVPSMMGVASSEAPPLPLRRLRAFAFTTDSSFRNGIMAAATTRVGACSCCGGAGGGAGITPLRPPRCDGFGAPRAEAPPRAGAIAPLRLPAVGATPPPRPKPPPLLPPRPPLTPAPPRLRSPRLPRSILSSESAADAVCSQPINTLSSCNTNFATQSLLTSRTFHEGSRSR